MKLAVDRLEIGARLLGAERLPGGVSAEVLRLDVLLPSGADRSVVFRQHRELEPVHRNSTIATKEFALLSFLHERGLAVPEPLAFVDDPTLHASVLITELVSGTTSVAATDLDASIDQMAEFLVGLHGLDPLEFAAVGLEPIEDPSTAVLPLLVHHAIAPRIELALASHAALRQSDARVKVVLHGDYWPGNVMWRDGRLAAVIDWEDACVGDPLADLATARVELLCQYGAHAMERFTDSYLESMTSAGSPVAVDDLPIWELYVSAAALASMHTWGLDPADESRRRAATTTFFDRAADQVSSRTAAPAAETPRLVIRMTATLIPDCQELMIPL